MTAGSAPNAWSLESDRWSIAHHLDVTNVSTAGCYESFIVLSLGDLLKVGAVEQNALDRCNLEEGFACDRIPRLRGSGVSSAGGAA